MEIIYETTVHSIGPEAASFLAERMLVTFGDNAPEELRDFCYCVDVNPCRRRLKIGDTMVIDGVRYPITAVGGVAQRNLESLGHVTLVLDGAADPRMDGSIHVAAESAPEMHVGSSISVEAS